MVQKMGRGDGGKNLYFYILCLEIYLLQGETQREIMRCMRLLPAKNISVTQVNIYIVSYIKYHSSQAYHYFFHQIIPQNDTF